MIIQSTQKRILHSAFKMAPKSPQLLAFTLLWNLLPRHIRAVLVTNRIWQKSWCVTSAIKPLQTLVFPPWFWDHFLWRKLAAMSGRYLSSLINCDFLSATNSILPEERRAIIRVDSPSAVKLPDDCPSGQHLDCSHTNSPSQNHQPSHSWFLLDTQQQGKITKIHGFWSL